jgi:hypothetical protein
MHGLTTQLRRLGLAQYPTNRVYDVGLSATIGTHYPHQLTRNLEISRIYKGFKSGEFYRS